MNQAYFHTSYTPTQFANHSSRTIREPRPRNSNQRGESRNKVAGVPRGEFDPAEVRDAALRDEFSRGSSFKCWKRFRAELYQDGGWRKYFTEPGAPDEVALLRRRHPTDFTFELISRLGERQVRLRSSDDLIDQLHLDMGRIYATLRSSHGLA